MIIKLKRHSTISLNISRILVSSTPANASSREISLGASFLAPAYFATTAENRGTYMDMAFSPPLKVKNTLSVSSFFFSPVFWHSRVNSNHFR